MTDPLPGDIFHRGQVLNNTYEIEGVLGRGGTGEVYRARNQITGRVVAVKALNRLMSANDAYIELMRREEEMRAITSDAIVRYTDCARTDDGHVYLVMDYVDGTPLSAWLERGGAEAADLIVVARRVAEGLVATHARNIVHRDLSPDNIILRRDDPAQAVIIDFGIAKDTNVGARTIVGQEFAGKYEYAAPEQMHGRAEPRSDLYALGASLLAVFRGAVPDVGRSPGEITRRKEQPLDTEGVPEPLRSIIAELSHPDPGRRVPSAAALVTEIDRLAAARAAPARPRRRGWLVLAPLAVLIAAALVGAWWYWLRPAGTEVAGTAPPLDLAPSPAAPPVTPPPPETPAPVPAAGPAAVPAVPAAAPAPSALAPLRAALRAFETCGPLALAADDPEQGPVVVTGRVRSERDAAALEASLRERLGGRAVEADLEVLNPAVCSVVRLLPDARGEPPMEITLGYRGSDRANPTGQYRPGDRPRFGLRVPDAITDGYLWVVLLDVGGDAVGLLPTEHLPNAAVADYPPSGEGSREIDFSDAFGAGFALTIGSENFGKSMVVALHTDEPLFPAPRPPVESVADFTDAIAQAIGGVTILSVAERVVETSE